MRRTARETRPRVGLEAQLREDADAVRRPLRREWVEGVIDRLDRDPPGGAPPPYSEPRPRRILPLAAACLLGIAAGSLLTGEDGEEGTPRPALEPVASAVAPASATDPLDRAREWRRLLEAAMREEGGRIRSDVNRVQRAVWKGVPFRVRWR